MVLYDSPYLMMEAVLITTSIIPAGFFFIHCLKRTVECNELIAAVMEDLDEEPAVELPVIAVESTEPEMLVDTVPVGKDEGVGDAPGFNTLVVLAPGMYSK